MENKRILKTVIFISLVLIPNQVQLEAYATNTHVSLHTNIVNEYKRLTGKSIYGDELKSFLTGATQEDEMIYIRPLNHFYDPINNKGLDDYVPGVEPKSIDWATNPYMQGNFTSNGHKADWRKDKKTRLLEYADDYSWQRAVYEYVHGDRARAMRSLGQVMHLLEDLTSVPHTRDDAHGGLGRGGESVYENFTTGKDSNVILRAMRSTNSIQGIFYHTAMYTNNNFLSTDTVFKKYKSPSIDIKTVNDGYLYNDLEAILVKVRLRKNMNGDLVVDDITLKNKKVMQSYWQHLSYKAVESGVALVDLFYKEVSEEQDTNKLKYMNKSKDEVEGLKDTINKANKFSWLWGVKAARRQLEAITQQELDGYKAAAKIYNIEFPEITYIPETELKQEEAENKEDQEEEKPKEEDNQVEQEAQEDAKEADKEGQEESIQEKRQEEQEAQHGQQEKPEEKSQETETINKAKLQAMLARLQGLLIEYQQSAKEQKEVKDPCAGKDMSIFKIATCVSPFEQGGFAIGAGAGAAASLEAMAGVGSELEGRVFIQDPICTDRALYDQMVLDIINSDIHANHIVIPEFGVCPDGPPPNWGEPLAPGGPPPGQVN